MDLTEFIEGVKRCPDELVNYVSPYGQRKIARLTYEHGIYDNWAILFGANHERMRELLVAEFDGAVEEDNIQGSSVTDYLLLGPNIAGIILANYIRDDCTTQLAFPEVSKEHLERQQTKYRSSAQIGTKGLLDDPVTFRSLANVACRIGQLCQREGIALCFPKSIGWKNRDDFTQIVYFEPETTSP